MKNSFNKIENYLQQKTLLLAFRRYWWLPELIINGRDLQLRN